MNKVLSRLSFLTMVGFVFLIFSDKNQIMEFTGLTLVGVGSLFFGILIAKKQNSKSIEIVDEIKKDERNDKK